MKKTFNILILASMATSLMLATGCATATHIVTGGQKTLIQSEPSGAELFLNGDHVGRTPKSVNLSPRKEYTVHIEMAGYKPYDTISTPGVGLLGGFSMWGGDSALTAICPPVGVGAFCVDFLTKDSKRHPESVTVKLEPFAQAPPPPYAPPYVPPVAPPQQPPPVAYTPPAYTPPPAPAAQLPPPPVVYHAPPRAAAPAPSAPDPTHTLPVARNNGTQ